jgi:hypothetical protein
MARGIERDILQMVGREELPPAHEVVASMQY